MKFPELIHGIHTAELIGLSIAIFMVAFCMGIAIGAIGMRKYFEALLEDQDSFKGL